MGTDLLKNDWKDSHQVLLLDLNLFPIRITVLTQKPFALLTRPRVWSLPFSMPPACSSSASHRRSEILVSLLQVPENDPGPGGKIGNKFAKKRLDAYVWGNESVFLISVRVQQRKPLAVGVNRHI